MKNAILGISAFYHDSAAALLVDGKIEAAAHEERFTRKKHDPSFPTNSVRYVLCECGLRVSDLSAIAFYDKPLIKFERLLETYHAFSPMGVTSFRTAIPVWIKEKLFMKRMMWEELTEINGEKLEKKPPLLFPEHHLSHAASAFYPSPFKEAAILTIDGVGEWATTTISHGKDNSIKILKELPFPHSIGLLYSAFTYYCGFKVNSGEYKLMGLAPYGNDRDGQVSKFKSAILEYLVDIKEDGSLILNMDYFDYATGLKMCQNDKWKSIFGIPKRESESEITAPYMNMALAIQQVTDGLVLKLAKTAKDLTGCNKLVMAGGVALNCVSNGKLLRSKIFDDLWIQPAAGDAGGALGAAYAAHHIWQSNPRPSNGEVNDKMSGSYLGPKYGDSEIERMCKRLNAKYTYYANSEKLCTDIAEPLGKGEIVGWHQGRMEWGPRALGSRSILGDPRHPEMQKRLNLKIKYREGFRPFAPIVLAEDASQYFELEHKSPYMLIIAPVKEERCIPFPEGYEDKDLMERLYHLRSDLPAITHIDYSARIQTVHKETNERLWELLTVFKGKTGHGVLVNTSFNVRGEPIVCTPEDSYRCFMRTEMDWLVIENFVFRKSDQPKWNEKEEWQETFKLD